MAFTLPNTISNESTRDARPIQANFQAIADALNNDYLPKDGTVATTGSLVLPSDPVAANQAATKAYVDAIIPVGTIADYAGAAAPSGWALCQGQLVDKSSNPLLYALLGSTYGTETGSQFYLPDLRDRVALGKGSSFPTLAASGGSKDAVVVSHTHGAGGLTATQGDHSHPATGGNTGAGYVVRSLGAGGNDPMYDPAAQGNGYAYTNPATAAASAGAITMGGSTASAGVAGTNANMPPYLVLNKIIRLG